LGGRHSGWINERIDLRHDARHKRRLIFEVTILSSALSVEGVRMHNRTVDFHTCDAFARIFGRLHRDARLQPRRPGAFQRRFDRSLFGHRIVVISTLSRYL
jgi:hypothetical protein